MTTAPVDTVFLVPGFFGFTNLAGIAYFAQVQAALERRFGELGSAVRLVGVKTLPTSALAKRAARLVETVAREAPHGAVHIIGHSTGGLDARFVGSPQANLETVDAAVLGDVRRRLRTVVAVATPHFGTPVATFFAQRAGEQLMKLLSLAAVHVSRVGPLPQALFADLVAVAGIGAAAPGDEIFRLARRHLLDDFDDAPRQVISEFFEDVWRDQSLLPQLAPEALAEITRDWQLGSDVRGGSVVIQAKRPGLAAMTAIGLDPVGQVLHQIFRLQQSIAKWRPPAMLDAAIDRARQALGDDFHVDGNDGVVPTASQLWGEPVAYAWADHLDVVGHFHAPDHVPPHYDWLPSGSGFRRPAFDRLWNGVADFVLGV